MPFTGFNELREHAALGREPQEAAPGDSMGTKKAPGIQPTGTGRQNGQAGRSPDRRLCSQKTLGFEAAALLRSLPFSLSLVMHAAWDWVAGAGRAGWSSRPKRVPTRSSCSLSPAA